ncbi:MAG: hypothetical protein HZB59_10975 [Ignavibacteriales bacterium]|nr:hypothetical protein [Ignavibacteriales bacterium]
MLEKEFKYYKDHQNELIEKYDGKFIVIRCERVVGAYDTELEAYNTAKKEFEIGSFLIQRCSPGKNSYTQRFHSRVTFRNQPVIR